MRRGKVFTERAETSACRKTIEQVRCEAAKLLRHYGDEFIAEVLDLTAGVVEVSLVRHGYDSPKTRFLMEAEAALWRNLRLKQRHTGRKGAAT